MEEESAKTLDVAEPVESEVATQEENATVEETEFEFSDSNEEKLETEKSTKEVDEEVESEEPKETKPKQSASENSKYAEARRKAESIDKKVDEAYKRGRLEAYKGKLNPYTNTEINDETDIRVYENMLALEKSGKDPINDYANYIADKERESEKERIKQEEIKENARKDIEEFTSKYPDINLTELLEDENFKDYIEGKNKPLTGLYENFNRMKNSFRNSAVEVAKKTIANAQASPGSLGSEANVTVDFENMSSKEFEVYLQKVKDGELK